MAGLDISYELGQIKECLLNIEKNTTDIKTEVKSVSSRVTKIENSRSFEQGADAQNKKLAAAIGTLGGMIGGCIITWVSRVLH